MARNKFTHLSYEEREDIAWHRRHGYSLRQIARILGRSHTTIVRELQRHDRGTYYPKRARHEAVQARKHKGQYVHLKNDTIRSYVIEAIRRGWSPEQISGRISHDLPGYSISHEAIYQYLYRRQNTNPCAYLATRRPKRRKCFAHNSRGTVYIRGKRPISEHPHDVNTRTIPRHWEADTISGREQRSSLIVLTERTTRFTLLALPPWSLATLVARACVRPDKTSHSFAQAVIPLFASLPTHLRRTLTLDNGSENAQFQTIERITQMKCYFCHPYHSWEKGTVENTNGLIRRMFPKKTDFRLVSAERILSFQRSLKGTSKTRKSTLRFTQLVAMQSRAPSARPKRMEFIEVPSITGHEKSWAI